MCIINALDVEIHKTAHIHTDARQSHDDDDDERTHSRIHSHARFFDPSTFVRLVLGGAVADASDADASVAASPRRSERLPSCGEIHQSHQSLGADSTNAAAAAAAGVHTLFYACHNIAFVVARSVLHGLAAAGMVFAFSAPLLPLHIQGIHRLSMSVCRPSAYRRLTCNRNRYFAGLRCG